MWGRRREWYWGRHTNAYLPSRSAGGVQQGMEKAIFTARLSCTQYNNSPSPLLSLLFPIPLDIRLAMAAAGGMRPNKEGGGGGHRTTRDETRRTNNSPIARSMPPSLIIVASSVHRPPSLPQSMCVCNVCVRQDVVGHWRVADFQERVLGANSRYSKGHIEILFSERDFKDMISI